MAKDVHKFMLATGGVLSERQEHGEHCVCFGNGQNEAE